MSVCPYIMWPACVSNTFGIRPADSLLMLDMFAAVTNWTVDHPRTRNLLLWEWGADLEAIQNLIVLKFVSEI